MEGGYKMTREEEIKNEAKLICRDIASEVDYKSSAAYDGFVMGAKWADKTLIEKACEWLENNLADKTSVLYSGVVSINFDNVLKDFRKAMEK